MSKQTVLRSVTKRGADGGNGVNTLDIFAFSCLFSLASSCDDGTKTMPARMPNTKPPRCAKLQIPGKIPSAHEMRMVMMM